MAHHGVLERGNEFRRWPRARDRHRQPGSSCRKRPASADAPPPRQRKNTRDTVTAVGQEIIFYSEECSASIPGVSFICCCRHAILPSKQINLRLQCVGNQPPPQEYHVSQACRLPHRRINIFTEPSPDPFAAPKPLPAGAAWQNEGPLSIHGVECLRRIAGRSVDHPEHRGAAQAQGNHHREISCAVDEFLGFEENDRHGRVFCCRAVLLLARHVHSEIRERFERCTRFALQRLYPYCLFLECLKLYCIKRDYGY